MVIAPQLSHAGTTTFRSNDVIPVVVEDKLTIRTARQGDRFYARPADERDLPRGSRFEGRVAAVREARNGRLASVDLEFTSILLPDGKRQAIRAVPIPFNDNSVARGGDGRFVARKDQHKREKYVFGGMAGGLILGSIFKKGTEGLIIGALAGIAAAETDKSGDGDLVLKSGTKVGALFEKSVTLNWDRRYDLSARTDRDDRFSRDDRTDRSDRNDRFDRDDRLSTPDRVDRDDRFSTNDDRDSRDDREASFRCGERDLRFSRELRPFRDRDTWMVPLERTSEQMKLRTDKVGRVFYIENDDSLLKVEVDSRDYRLNGRRLTADRPVIERNGVVFIPLSMLAGVTTEIITIDGKRLETGR